MQKPVYFRNKGQFIAGTLHMPDGRGRRPAVALFHGFTGDKAEAAFIFVALSRMLAENGIASLRIDFRGSGESEGRFEDMTPLEELSDARAALARLRRTRGIDPRRLGVVGLSLGGLVAALAAGAEPDLKSAVLWAAVATPLDVFTAMSRPKQLRELRREGRSDFDGLYVGRDFMRTLSALDPPAELARSRAAVLVVHGTADEIVPFSNSTLYLRAAEGRPFPARRVAVEGANHVFSSVVWRNTALKSTVNWLRETL
jgi:hypothetical protein